MGGIVEDGVKLHINWDSMENMLDVRQRVSMLRKNAAADDLSCSVGSIWELLQLARQQ